MPEATILIVDDEPANLAVLSTLLQPTYRVLAANGGKRALHIAASDPHPDLLLLDVMMPVTNGYEVLTQLKSNPATSHIPDIFITAMSATDDEERGLELGSVDYTPNRPGRPSYRRGYEPS